MVVKPGLRLEEADDEEESWEVEAESCEVVKEES